MNVVKSIMVLVTHRPSPAIAAAWVIHAIAWFVPVHKYGVRLPAGVPGVEAFMLALTAPFDPSASWDPWSGPVVASASALTNFVMLASLPIVVRGSPQQQKVLAWMAVGATVLNAYWWMDGNDRADLRVGYYLWWISFMVLAWGAFRLARAQKRNVEASPSSVVRRV